MNVSLDTAAAPIWKGDLVSLALELQALESETFEVQDYAGVNDMNTAAPVAPGGGSSTSSSCSSCCSTCSTTSTCA